MTIVLIRPDGISWRDARTVALRLAGAAARTGALRDLPGALQAAGLAPDPGTRNNHLGMARCHPYGGRDPDPLLLLHRN